MVSAENESEVASVVSCIFYIQFGDLNQKPFGFRPLDTASQTNSLYFNLVTTASLVSGMIKISNAALSHRQSYLA